MAKKTMVTKKRNKLSKKDELQKRSEHREKNREKINRQHREHYARNKKSIREKANKLRQDNLEQERAKQRERYTGNKKFYQSYNRDIYKKNQSKILSQKRQIYHVKSDERKKLKIEVFTTYSKRLSNSDVPCCACCGEKSYIEFLAIDHIHGRKSAKHRKGAGGNELYRWLKDNKFPKGFQVLCHNCNSAKKDTGFCPHQK